MNCIRRNALPIAITIALIACTPAASASSCSFSLLAPDPYTVGGKAGDIAVADFNKDGYLDAAIVDRTFNYISYLPGQPGGAFGNSITILIGEPTQADIAAVDWNNDGNMDIVLLIPTIGQPPDTVYSHLKILYGHGDGTFEPHDIPNATQNPKTVAVADFNSDGKPDLAILNGEGFDVYLNGSSFPRSYNVKPNTAGFLLSIAAGDFDGDGKLDVAYSETTNNLVYVRFGNGDGTFTTTDVPLATQDAIVETDPQSLATGDFNGDGKADIAVANNDWRGTYTAKLSILLSNGDRTFAPAVHYGTLRNAHKAAVADLDGDGVLDVVIANTDGLFNSSVMVFRGNGDGTFQAQQPFAVGGVLVGLAIADLNGDGGPDVLITDFVSGGLSVFRNTCAQLRLSMSSSANPVSEGTDVTVTVTAIAPAAPVPTGTITLSRASSILSSVNLASSNSTSATLSDLTPGTYLIAASYSGDSHFTAATATMQQVVVIPPFGPPPKLNAISTGGPVAVSWIGTRDVDHYEVWRNNGAGWNPISTAPQAEYSDSTVGANLAYLYRVRGFTAGGLPSDFSPVDAAVTFVFMDNTIMPGVTPIRLTHLTELRSAVNSLRNVYGLGSFGWAESSPTMVSASQWIELRDAVNATRNAIGQAPLAYTDPALSSGATIRAVHVEELRAGIR